jgi:hypothetical protein
VFQLITFYINKGILRPGNYDFHHIGEGVLSKLVKE